MFWHNLSRHVKPVVAKGAVAAGQGDTQTSSAVGLTNGEQGVRFVVLLGTVAAGGSGTIKLQHSNDNGSTDAYADVAGSGYSYTSADSGNAVVIDVYRPQKPYLECLVIRGGSGNTTINSILADVYQLGLSPEPNDSTVSKVTVITNAATGTA